MTCCVAVGCSNRAGVPNVSFYRFPTEKEKRQNWINAVKREGWTPTEHSRLCSQHFISGAKSSNPLSPDYIPSVFSYTSSPEKKKQAAILGKYERRMNTKRRKLENVERETAATALLELSSVNSATPITDIPEQASADAATTPTTTNTSDRDLHTDLDVHSDGPELTQEDKGNQTDNNKCTETMLSMADIDALQNVANYNLTKNRELQEKVLSLELNEETFRENPEKVKVFTGLSNFTMLMAVFSLIGPYLKDHANTVLSPFHQLLVTLMRLRLNVTVQFLSYIFHVHHSTVVRTFANVMNILNEKLVPLTIRWPDREALRKTLPYIFRVTFPKCVSIIDCFEVFIERPSNLDSKAQTYSNYKSHNTVKYLISMSPQGFVNFISKGWGGRTSDKQITEQSGYLPLLFPGDTVLADRGFTIQESIGSHGACLQIPAFTRGKSQLALSEVERTRNLASVRIHVERVIGHIRRKYPILDSTVPIKLLITDETELTSLDKIVRVACGLTNVCSSVVPFD